MEYFVLQKELSYISLPTILYKILSRITKASHMKQWKMKALKQMGYETCTGIQHKHSWFCCLKLVQPHALIFFYLFRRGQNLALGGIPGLPPSHFLNGTLTIQLHTFGLILPEAQGNIIFTSAVLSLYFMFNYLQRSQEQRSISNINHFFFQIYTSYFTETWNSYLTVCHHDTICARCQHVFIL